MKRKTGDLNVCLWKLLILLLLLLFFSQFYQISLTVKLLVLGWANMNYNS